MPRSPLTEGRGAKGRTGDVRFWWMEMLSVPFAKAILSQLVLLRDWKTFRAFSPTYVLFHLGLMMAASLSTGTCLYGSQFKRSQTSLLMTQFSQATSGWKEILDRVGWAVQGFWGISAKTAGTKSPIYTCSNYTSTLSCLKSCLISSHLS